MTDQATGQVVGAAPRRRQPRPVWRCQGLAAAGLLLAAMACGYYRWAGPLYPAETVAPEAGVTEEGEARWGRDGIEVRIKALSHEELDRQFASRSAAGRYSTNPYTFGDTRFWDGKAERERFTVFRLSVTNEGFAKVKVDPARMVLRTADGQELWPMGLEQLQAYYRAYVTGYEGNAYARYQERIDVLRRTMYQNEEIFRGQRKDGYVVFPLLPPRVSAVSVVVEDVVLRFDARGEPVETVEIGFPFRRDVGRLYGDGRVILEKRGLHP